MPDTMLEGRDFSSEAGLMVLSREYLLARGTCCGSHCRNCPFEFASAAAKAERSAGHPVVSLVPSLTETLLAAGANVVGRTRYCLHPRDLAHAIPVVGGTKSLDTARLPRQAEPLFLLDREENPKEFVDSIVAAGFSRESIVDVHVHDFASLAKDLGRLAEIFAKHSNPGVADRLRDYAARAQIVGKSPAASAKMQVADGALPGVLRATRPIAELLSDPNTPVAYVIWKDPWMAIGPGTWVSAMLEKVWGVLPGRLRPIASDSRYPEFSLRALTPGTLILLSSEPFPFGASESTYLKHEAEFLAAGAAAVGLVNGEEFSWFGLRSLRFAEDAVLTHG